MPITSNNFQITTFTYPGGERGVKLTNFNANELGGFLIRMDYRSSDDLVDLALVMDVVRRYGGPGLRVSLRLPYIPYARQDRAETGVPLSLKVFADFINSFNFNTVTVSDPHSDVATALINNCRVTHQATLFGRFMDEKYPNHKDVPPITLLAPDAGSLKKVYLTAQQFRADVVVGMKHRDPMTGEITGTSIPEQAKLEGKVVYVVDDICDGGRTFVELAKALTVKPAELHLFVTHGIFSKGKEELLKYYNTVNAAYDRTEKVE